MTATNISTISALSSRRGWPHCGLVSLLLGLALDVGEVPEVLKVVATAVVVVGGGRLVAKKKT